MQQLLEELLQRHRQPGVVAAVCDRGEVTVAAAGSANLRHGVPMTTGTAFLTGSITKVWMTTLVMTFVEEGRLSLDDTVASHLPWARLGTDADVQEQLTLRTLLCHSSGIDAGDQLLDTGPYPVGVEPYVRQLATVGHLHAPGRFTSYNNAGWLVLELVLKALTGKDFHTLLPERVLRPLGLERTVLGAAQAILHPTAVGHLPREGGGHEVTPRFLLPESFAAAGTTLVTTVEDTLHFLRLHLGDGSPVLSAGSVTAMQQPQAPDPSGPETGFALGWRYTDTAPGRVFHHGGGSYGGLAMALLSPADDFAYVAFANASDSMGLHEDLQAALTGKPAVFAVPPVESRLEGADVAPLLGTYRRKTQVVTVSEGPEGLDVEVAVVPEDFDAEGYDQGQPTQLRARLRDAQTAVTLEPANQGVPYVMTFLDPEPRCQLLSMGGRIAKRV